MSEGRDSSRDGQDPRRHNNNSNKSYHNWSEDVGEKKDHHRQRRRNRSRSRSRERTRSQHSINNSSNNNYHNGGHKSHYGSGSSDRGGRGSYYGPAGSSSSSSNGTDFSSTCPSSLSSSSGRGWGGGFGDQSVQHYQPGLVVDEPSRTVIMKGLSSLTTESMLHDALAVYAPQDIRLITRSSHSRERDQEYERSESSGKGLSFAFVEFPTLEHAEYFMSTFAGSRSNHRDRDAQQLIIENRAVSLEYCSDERVQGRRNRDMDRERDRDRDRDHYRASPERGGEGGGGGTTNTDHRRSTQHVSDWLCSQCSTHNFARRRECFRCKHERTEACSLVPSDDTASSHSLYGNSGFNLQTAAAEKVLNSSKPTCFLVVRGVHPYVSEEQITDVFRQFAAVKSVRLVRSQSRGSHHVPLYGKKSGSSNSSSRTGIESVAFVEFFSPDHAQFVLQGCAAAGEADRDNNNSESFDGDRDGEGPTSSSSSLSSLILGVLGLDASVAFCKERAMNNLIATAEGAAANAVAATAGSAAHGISSSYNALAFAALQRAQWAQSSNNNNNTAATAGSNGPPPYSALAPAPPPPLPSYAAPASSSSHQLGPFGAHKRWPPNFDTNGGSYLFQPHTGLFLDHNSGFFYDPKSKLYYCSQDGLYYSYDDVNHKEAPFRLFRVPVPTETGATAFNATSAASVINCGSTTTTTTTANNMHAIDDDRTAKITITTNSVGGTTAVAVAANVKVPPKIGSGFSLLSGGKGKKVLKDIGKWNSLAADEDNDDHTSDGKSKDSSTCAGNGGGVSAASKTMKVAGRDEAAMKARATAALDALNSFPSSTRAGRAIGVDVIAQQQQQQQKHQQRPAQGGTVAAAAGSSLESSSGGLMSAFTNDQLEKLVSDGARLGGSGVGISATASTAPVASTRTAASTSAAAAAATTTTSAAKFCCLLCRRQFGSAEVLSRHEKESKLHAENLALAAAAASSSNTVQSEDIKH